MLKRLLAVCLFALATCTCIGYAQSPDYGNLDPQPYDQSVEPDIDMFMRSWKESLPQKAHGSIITRTILLPSDGDPLRPGERGKVLTNLKRFNHGILQPLTIASSAIPADDQEIIYIESGRGTIAAGPVTADLYTGVGVIIPPGTSFELANTSDEPLTMYLFTEHVPDGFEPKSQIVVHDENVLPFASTNVHWTHCYKSLFGGGDGLATLRGMGPVWFNPMTMGQPHSHGEGVEEIWFALDGDVTILIGKEIRKLPVGTAYKIPPNGKTPHSTINNGDEFIKVFWFMN